MLGKTARKGSELVFPSSRFRITSGLFRSTTTSFGGSSCITSGLFGSTRASSGSVVAPMQSEKAGITSNPTTSSFGGSSCITSGLFGSTRASSGSPAPRLREKAGIFQTPSTTSFGGSNSGSGIASGLFGSTRAPFSSGSVPPMQREEAGISTPTAESDSYPFKRAVEAVGPFVVSLYLGESSYGDRVIGAGLFINAHTILTCAHAVVHEHLMRTKEYKKSVKQVDVTLSTGEKRNGVVSDIYLNDGLALVKIDESIDSPISMAKLPDLGISYQVRQGEPVCSFGSPDGDSYLNSVSGGVISHINRVDADLFLPDNGGQYWQTDCPFNEGNEGGPICNTRGEVIGLVFRSYDGTRFFNGVVLQGVTFVIPIEKAWRVLNLKNYIK